MPKGTDRVEFGASQALSWPRLCVLCLSPATEEVSTLIGGCRIPYCDPCHAKVQRLRLILRARLADPGVKLLKSKRPGITAVRFSNPQYADAFRKANSLIPWEKGKSTAEIAENAEKTVFVVAPSGASCPYGHTTNAPRPRR